MSKKQIELDRNYFFENRDRFFNEIGDNSFVVLFSGTAQRKSADQYYHFEGNNNFFYLTGIRQEGSVLIIRKSENKIIKLMLCIRTHDAHEERWNGIRISRSEASRISGIYDTTYSEGLDGILKSKLSNFAGCIYADKDNATGSSVWFADFMDENFPEIEIKDAFPIFSKLRRIKSEYEVSLIKKAIEATNEGIMKIYKSAHPGIAEYELATEYAGVLGRLGLGEPSFDSIVATGQNFNYLHYPDLNSIIMEGDMILLDVGASYGGLCSDISRAFPVDGKFSKKQKIVYDIVLECQKLAFSLIKPGTYIKDINAACMQLAGESLIAAGVLNKIEEVNQYYWHNVSHHLGLDVHDICGRDVCLEEGMVLTVEPGVYVPEWNIGLRIEDDVWINADGCEIISNCVPREIDEIEAILAQRV